VVVVSQSHYLMLQRNLVYTALTRAKRRAVIVVTGGLANRQTGAIYRGGDRQGNRALYLLVVGRMRWDPATRAYVNRRTAEGRTKPEIIRCLKR
jgi:hypothetical protein